MYELLNDIKETYVLQLPQGQGRPYAKDMWHEEIKLFKQKIEDKFGVEITDEQLREAAEFRNEYRRTILELFEMQTNEPPAMMGCEMLMSVLAGTFSLTPREYLEQLKEKVAEIKKNYKENGSNVDPSRKRILVTGSPSSAIFEKVAQSIENNGGVIVCFDDCSGERTQNMMVDPEADDILRAISDRYLSINCSVMTPNDGRLDNTMKMVEKYHVDGIVDCVLHACHTFNIEAALMERRAKGEKLPYLKIETDYSPADKGQLNTRIAAFMEML